MKPPNVGGVEQQTVEHLFVLLNVARKWRKQRRKLVRELEKEGVKWQPQVERRWLAGLLGDEKSSGAITKVFENNRNRRKRRGEGEGVGMGTEKRPSR